MNAVLPDALFQEYCIADTPINQTLTQERLPIDGDGFLDRADRAGPRRHAGRGRRRALPSRLDDERSRHGGDRQDRSCRACGPRRARDPGRREQRPAPRARPRGARHRLDERLDVHRRRRQHLHRLPRRLRPAAARPRRPRRRRRRRGRRARGRADGHRRHAHRGRAGREDRRARAVGRARAADRDRQRGDLPRAARRARRDRAAGTSSSSRAATTAGTTRSR